MKTRYRVLVQEKYSKWVDVYAHSESDMKDEVRTMEECGEIDWDRGEDFDEWNILESEMNSYTNSEIAEAEQWCKNQVLSAWIVDPDWVCATMTPESCMEWLEQMRDNGMCVPECIESKDLWMSVLEKRKGIPKHAQV
jgi:hypothetical protein